jgi:tetratricopeptide (TPR) repeat protein
MYGGIPPTPTEAKADQELIDYEVKKLGSREAGARDAVRLGFKYLAQSDWRTAIKRFNQAWLINGESAEVFWGFGAALSYEGKFPESEIYFQKASALTPENGRLLIDYGFMYQFWATRGTKDKTAKQKYLDKSIELFQHGSSLEPSYERAYFDWAVSLFFKKDYSGAWEKIKQAEKLGGKSIDAKFLKDLTGKMPKPRA